MSTQRKQQREGERRLAAERSRYADAGPHSYRTHGGLAEDGPPEPVPAADRPQPPQRPQPSVRSGASNAAPPEPAPALYKTSPGGPPVPVEK